MSELTQPPQLLPQQPEIDAFDKPAPNKPADQIGVIGFGTVVCEVVTDPRAKGDCRKLLEPLEKGTKDPIDVLVDLLVNNPDEMDAATDRFNYNMQEAMKKAEAIIAAETSKVPNAT